MGVSQHVSEVLKIANRLLDADRLKAWPAQRRPDALLEKAAPT
jgi:hypothetical protein